MERACLGMIVLRHVFLLPFIREVISRLNGPQIILRYTQAPKVVVNGWQIILQYTRGL